MRSTRLSRLLPQLSRARWTTHNVRRLSRPPWTSRRFPISGWPKSHLESKSLSSTAPTGSRCRSRLASVLGRRSRARNPSPFHRRRSCGPVRTSSRGGPDRGLVRPSQQGRPPPSGGAHPPPLWSDGGPNNPLTRRGVRKYLPRNAKRVPVPSPRSFEVTPKERQGRSRLDFSKCSNS